MDNEEDASACQACGGSLAAPVPQKSELALDDYARPAVLVTIFGCMPLGVLAQVHAGHVKTRLALGDEQGARESARKAARWCWIGAGVGAVIWALALFALSSIAAAGAAP